MLLHTKGAQGPIIARRKFDRRCWSLINKLLAARADPEALRTQARQTQKNSQFCFFALGITTREDWYLSVFYKIIQG